MAHSQVPIFHERQQGALCAQHALNNLLQAPQWDPVQLADIAQRLDDAERIQLAEAGLESKDYLQSFQARCPFVL